MNELVLEISAFAVSLFCLIDCLSRRKEQYLPFPKGIFNKIRDQHFIYIILLLFLMISSILDVVNVSIEYEYIGRSRLLSEITNEAYFIFHAFLPTFFAVYIINITCPEKIKSKPFYCISMIPFLASEALIITNPFTDLVYYLDENGAYHRGSMMPFIYGAAAIYVVSCLIFFFIYKNTLSKLNRAAVLIIIFIATTGMVIQGIFSINVELFFESTGLLCFMLLLEENDLTEKREKTSRISKGFVVVIALIFTTVIGMNISLIYNVGTGQTEKIGEIQLSSIKGDLQQTISEDESNLLKYSMGLEQLVNSGAGPDKLEKYIRERQSYYSDISDGNCIGVYAAAPGWVIKPDFEIPEGFETLKRPWYKGAVKNPGKTYITDPYVDADSGNLCVTFSYCFSDGKTVAAMDYTLNGIQAVIGRMSDNVDQTALIVTETGVIVGCSNDDYQGKELSEALGQYTEVFNRVNASNEHKSFHANISDSGKIIFSSETNNGWSLILAVDDNVFYADTINQIILLGAIDFMMIAIIIAFYLVSVNNHQKAENTLASTENLIAGISSDIRVPLQDIMAIAENTVGLDDQAKELALLGIYEAGESLQEKLDDLFSYSNIMKENLQQRQEEESHQNRVKRRSTVSSKRTRNGITGILFGALIAGLILCVVVTTKWGTEKISREADSYNNEVTLWMEKNKSILTALSDVVSVDPKLMNNYDDAVKWLNDITKHYDEITFAYLANAGNKKHQIIMNNGWVPDKDYKVEQRQWYIDTKVSDDGFNISAPYFDAQTGMYCITFSRCVYTKKGTFVGVLAIDCLLDKLIDVLDDSYTEDSYAFMVDQTGIIINHPYKAYEISDEKNTNIEDTEYADVFHNNNVFGMKDYNGTLVASHSEKSELSGFTVIVSQSWWSIYGPVLIISLIFLIMIIISIIGVVKMINRFIKWQTEATEQLILAADKADAAARTKSTFLAQMSHEIRTPINAVLGMNEMILRESSERSIREYADSIQTSGKNLLNLINSILDFSKIEEGKMEIVPVRYETASLISYIITSVSQRAEAKGLILEAHVDPELPVSLYGDDMRVAQIAINLLTNAVKYTEEGRVDLYVDWIKKNNGTYRLKMTVTDTGIGIKEDDLEKLFDTFTRFDETKNHSIEGTGLGMAIVKHLLDMMNGNINVKSVYGEGSTFSFEVEQSIIDNNAIGDYEERIAESKDALNSNKQLYTKDVRLLIVDDNDMNLRVATNLLKLNGITPDQANSGRDALEFMKKNEYDLILLDHMMPEMDGIDTLQEAKENNLIAEGCTVIVLTANAVAGAKESYIKAGFDDYLSKPLEVYNLEKALKRYLPKEKIEYRDREITRPAKASEAADGADGNASDQYNTESENSGIFEILNKNGIATKSALNYFGGDENFYIETLKGFYDTAHTRTDELTESLAEEDLKSYAIRVHALKSNAKTLGAGDLFEAAYILEKAAKDEDMDTVSDGHPKLLEKVNKVVDIIGLTPIAEMASTAAESSADDDEVIEFGPN